MADWVLPAIPVRQWILTLRNLVTSHHRKIWTMGRAYLMVDPFGLHKRPGPRHSHRPRWRQSAGCLPVRLTSHLHEAFW